MSSISVTTDVVNNIERANAPTAPSWVSRTLIAGMLVSILVAFALDRFGDAQAPPPAAFLFGGIAVVLGSVLVLLDSRTGISVFILFSCVSPRMNGNFRMEDLMVPAIALVWFGRMARGDTFRLRSPITLPLVAVAITMILSFLWGEAQGSNQGPVEGVLIMFKRIEYGLLFVFALNSVRTQQDGKAILKAFLGGAIIAAAIGLTTAGSDTRVGDTRATGLDLDNYNTFAGFLVIAASLALAGACQYRGKVRLVFALIALLMISTLLKTYSREGYFMLGVSVATLGVIRYRALIPIVLVMIIFSQWLIPETVLDRVNDAMSHLETYQTDSSGSNSFTARVGGWSNRWVMVVAHPIMGNGPGSAPLHIDNEYLLRQIESGVIGLAAFLWLITALGRYLLACSRRLRGTEAEAFTYGLIAAYVSVVMQGTVSAAWSTIRTMEPFWILTGAVGGLVIHQNFLNEKSEVTDAATTDGD